MQIEEYARLKDVPVFRAGEHNGETYSPEVIEEMLANTQECLDFLQESIQTGQYRENPHILTTKSIPGFLNLNHQGYLSDSLKELVKDVTVSFGKQVIDGKEWLTASFDNVRADIAQFLKAKFPFRSIEVIPELYHPGKEKWFKNVIRSVGFLDPETPPAVDGQLPELAVEFAAKSDRGVVVLYSQYQPDQGDHDMAKQNKEQLELEQEEPRVEQGKAKAKAHDSGISPQEFSALQVRIQEMEQKMQQAEDRVKQYESENQKLQSAISQEQQVTKQQDIQMFCDRLIHEYHASPAFVDVVKPHLDAAQDSMVLEFAEGEAKSLRQSLKDLVIQVVEMKKNDAITVPEGQQIDTGSDPLKAMPKEQQRDALVKEFMNNDNLSYGEAWTKAAHAHPDLF